MEYTLVRKNIKNVYVYVQDGQVIVKAPKNVSVQVIEDFLIKRKKWIEERLKQEDKKRLLNVEEKYIYILGKKIDIEYKKYDKKKIKVVLTKKECIVYLPKDFKLEEQNYAYLETEIINAMILLFKDHVEPIMKKYCKMTGLYPTRVVVKIFKSVWGKCTSKREIRLNARLMHYSDEQIEYVCLHEIAHLKYMNHQKEFWGFVKKYMPNYKEISAVLKQ